CAGGDYGYYYTFQPHW
nr:immunoglobulin heavy chain junction region [Macaca mulatta]